MMNFNDNKVGKMFQYNGALCKIIQIIHKGNEIIYSCVNYQNGERFFLDKIEE